MTEVVAALIRDGDRFLACRRPPHKARGLLWEFVGGKVEPGETKEQALIRECREELDIDIAVGPMFMELTHEYPDLTVRLTLFRASIRRGEPRLLEHSEMRWLLPTELDGFDFCPADEEILNAIRERYAAVLSLRERLFALQDKKYRAFSASLIPNVPEERIIGVRTPALRQLAREFGKTPEAELFLKSLPHLYLEEYAVHSALAAEIKDYDRLIAALDELLPYVDNWATCDMLSPKLFKKHPAGLIGDIRRWMDSPEPYTVRFGMGMLMAHYLDDGFRPEYLDWVAEIRSQEYYVNMMAAWYFATALAKQYDSALPYLEERRLPLWTHNKAIQKAVESRRISEDQKAYLRTLRRKQGQRGAGNARR